MYMFKFHTIGAYNRQVNIPDATADVALKNGLGVNFDEGTRKATLHAKGLKPYVVMNLLDKPELASPNDYTIEVGEYARLFDVDSLAGLTVEFDSDATGDTIADLKPGDTLGFIAGTGRIGAAGDTTVAHFEVVSTDSAYGGRVIAVVRPAKAATTTPTVPES